MENFDEHLENEYRKRFEDFEEMPDDLLWKNIQARIEPEKEKPLVIWWNALRSPMGMAASVLLGLLIGVYFLIKSDDVQPIGNLPEKPASVASTPTKPSLNQKDNIASAESAKTTADDEGIANAARRLASGETDGKKATQVKESLGENKQIQLPASVQQEDKAIANKTIEEKTEEINKNAIEAKPAKPIAQTELATEASNKQTDGDKTVLANKASEKIKETIKATAEEKADETKLAMSPIAGQPLGNSAALVNENSVLKDTLFQDINSLIGKNAHVAVTAKSLQAPEVPAYEEPIVFEEEKRRLVFIPPTEVFANVTSTLSYYMFAPNKGDQIMVNNFSSNSQRLGFAAQLGFVYPLAKKLDLRTGLSYSTGKSRITYGITDEAQKSITVLNDNSIQINPGKSTKNENRNWQYFELQSDVLYEVRRMQAVSLGMKFGVQTAAMNQPLLQARLGYRISRPIAQRWALWLEPSVSFSLLSHNSMENLFMYRTNGLGLNMGVSLLR